MTSAAGETRSWREGAGPYVVNISRWLSLGWQSLVADFFGWILLTLVYLAIVTVASTTAIGAILVLGPLEVGWYAVILCRLREGRFDIGELGKGFSRFVPAFLASAVIVVFSSIGFVFLILPGLLILALYIFAFPLISDHDIDFWTALEASRKTVQQRLLDWTLFVIVQAFLLFLGVLLCGVGILVVLPWMKIATAIAYEEVFGSSLETPAVAH